MVKPRSLGSSGHPNTLAVGDGRSMAHHSISSLVFTKGNFMTRTAIRRLAGFTVCAVGILAPSAPILAGQDPPPTPPAATPPPAERAATPEPRPYDRVITKEAKSDPGVFTVHRIGERIFYEIPKAELDKEFLWVSQIARTTLGVGQGGQAAGNRVVRWERRNNRVFLRNVSPK